MNPVSTNPAHVAAYGLVVTGFYFAPKFAVLIESGRVGVLRANLAGVMLVVAYVLAEIGLSIGFDVNLYQWVSKLKTEDAIGTVAGVRLPRAYGLSEEPLNLALYLATAGSLAVWFAWKRFHGLGRAILVATVGAWLLALSTTGLVAASVGVGALCAKWTIRRIRAANVVVRKRIVIYVMGVVVLSLVGLTLIVGVPGFTVEGSVFEKLARYSVSPRIENVLETLQRISVTERPWFGVGLGSGLADIGGSAINWYFTLAYQGGLLSLTCVALFFSAIIARNGCGRSSLSDVGLFVAAYSAIHYLATATFFQPAAWSTLAAISALQSSGIERTRGYRSQQHEDIGASD